MNQEEKLRNALRGYYDSQQTPFDENDWERAGAILRATRNKRRLRYIIPVLAVLLPALFIACFYFPGMNGNDKHQSSLSPDQKRSSASDLQSSVIQQKSRLSSATDKSSEHLVQNHTSTTKTPATNSRLLSNKIQEASEIKAPEPEHAVAGDKTIPDETPAPDMIAGVPQSPANVAVEGSVPNADAPGVSAVSGENNTNEEKIVMSENPANDQIQEKEMLPVSIDALTEAATTFTVADDKKETKIADTIPQETKPAAREDAGSVAATTSTAAPQADSLRNPPLVNDLAGEGIFYELGAAWLYGWKGPAKRDARGFSPVAGINYMNQLGKRSAFSFGLGYLRVPGLSNSSKTSRVSTYTYGEQSRVTVITPSTIHYLVAPLRVHYFMDQRNAFGVGVNLAYLLNVDATVTSYDENPGFTGNYSTMKQSGYTRGFSWFDSQLTFLYRRNISSALGIQAEVFLGLTDVKQNEFFGLGAKERNSGARLSLVYYAFRKNNKR